jgi:tetratricopeptide (TPR) repeat protein
VETYKVLAAAQLAQGKQSQAVQTHKRLLKHHPTNLDALVFLAQHYQSCDDPFSARDYVQRARQLKPTSEMLSQMAWRVHVASARHYALQGEWDRSRAEFDEADRIDPSSRESLAMLVRRSLLELKARNLDSGEEIIKKAQSCYREPTAALLALAIEATRYDLSQTAQKGFQRQLRSALKKKAHSQTAGRLCELMHAYLALDVDYRGRTGHVKLVLSYVRRCGRVQWQEEDLRDVCRFLDELGSDDDDRSLNNLLEKLARKGLKQFPGSALFHLLVGQAEIRKGPLECDRRLAHQCFERTLELTKNVKDPEHETYAQRAKLKISFLEEMGLDEPPRPRGRVPGVPFGAFPPSGFGPQDILEMIGEMCESMGIDPEDLLEDFAGEEDTEPPRIPRSSSRRRKRRRGRARSD